MLSVPVNSVPLRLIIVAEKLTLAVYENKTTESQSARRTNGRRTTILEAIVGLSQVGWKGMLSVSVNSVPLRLIIVAEKLTLAVYGNKTAEAQSV